MPSASRKINWEDTGLVPTAGLAAWHQAKLSEAANGFVSDTSGNNRDLVQASSPPVFTENLLNGQPGWVFDGTKNPLVYPTNVTAQHAFVLAAAEGSAFDEYRGLLSGQATTSMLTSNNTGTKFFFLAPDWAYKKSSLAYDDANMQAPMNLVPELIEYSNTSPFVMDGIQVGQHINLTARKWKGYFFEQLIYDTIQTGRELERIYLYFNIKFAQWRMGLPFYFPSDDIVIPRRRRFYAEPPDWKKVTDSYEYEDGGRDFNTVSDNAPRRWEYDYRLVNRTASTDPPEVAIFDEFYNQAQIAYPFTFRDKYGVEWPNVRVESYNRTHREHKPWEVNVDFRLIGHTSSSGGTLLPGSDILVIDGGEI